MRCPKCKAKRSLGDKECPFCGIIYERYVKTLVYGRSSASRERQEAGQLREYLASLCFKLPDNTGSTAFYGRILVLVGLLFYSVKFIFSPVATNAAAESFLHLINLPFHEFGHILFRPLGQFMSSLGGTLGQLLMPAICFYVFLFRQGDAFGACVAFWWFGQNFLDIAPYVYDARILQMPLLGGNVGHSSPYGFHDWEYLLTETGLLAYDQTIATMFYLFGAVIMVGSLLWGGVLLRMLAKHR